MKKQFSNLENPTTEQQSEGKFSSNDILKNS